MSEALQSLREIGAQKIYEQTHIPTVHIQAILHESFDDLNKVQFMGFISILEREYQLDLQEVKLQGIAYFDDNMQREDEKSIFLQTDKKNKNRLIYLLLFVVLFVIVFVVYFIDSDTQQAVLDHENEVSQELNSEIVASEPVKEEQNISKVTVELQSDQNLSKKIEKSLQIKTDKKLWIGYIELATNKKKQKTFTGTLELDPNIDWLIILAHGYVDFEIDGETKHFTKPEGLKFLYKEGKLKQIDFKEFKRLNRGRAW
ncbi:MAG: hypothetical protein FAF05_01785 [Epsilonproteobacteria bacterium]|nr:hypothetical protein [Campylobacterota bacterium]